MGLTESFCSFFQFDLFPLTSPPISVNLSRLS